MLDINNLLKKKPIWTLFVLKIYRNVCLQWIFLYLQGPLQESIKWHVIRHHLPLESVPFHCSVCKYRAKNKSQLLCHFDSNNYKKHQLMNVDNQTTEECMVIPEPAYNVTFSYDSVVMSRFCLIVIMLTLLMYNLFPSQQFRRYQSQVLLK